MAIPAQMRRLGGPNVGIQAPTKPMLAQPRNPPALGLQPQMQAQQPVAQQPVAQQTMQPQTMQAAVMPQNIPQTGLIGSEQALQAGMQGGLSALQTGMQQGRGDIMNAFGFATSALGQPVNVSSAGVNQAIGQGVSALEGFAAPGASAQNARAALSGALGPEAQQQAYAQFNESPGQAWLREQAERSVLRNASATGGLGGGRVLEELQRQAIGLAQQDFQNQFNRLGDVTNTSLQAAGQVGQLRGQQAGFAQQRNLAQAEFQNQRASQAANIAAQLGGQLGQMGFQGGQFASGLVSGTGQQLAQGRTQAGQAIAGNIQQSSQDIANLLRQQGVDLSNITGQGAGNMSAIMQAAAQAQAAGNIELATLLSNIATGSASQRTGLPALPGTQQTQGAIGGIGQFLGGLGTAYQSFSDARLKENVQKIGQLESGLWVYSWDWTPEAKEIVGDQPAFGVIAQEVAEVIPEAVMVGPDGFLRVNYSMVA